RLRHDDAAEHHRACHVQQVHLGARSPGPRSAHSYVRTPRPIRFPCACVSSEPIPARSPRRPDGGIGPVLGIPPDDVPRDPGWIDRKSTRLNSSHVSNSYAVFCLKKKYESDVDHIDRPLGMDITVVTSAPTREERRNLPSVLG